MRRKKHDDPIEVIRREFADIYGDWGLELPETLESKGTLNDGGWSITYVFRELNGEPTLDLLGEHRMTNMQHTRITGSGEVIGLDTFMEAVPFDPAVDADEAAGRRRYDEHNQRVTSALQASGLI